MVALFLPRLQHRCSNDGLSSYAAHIELLFMLRPEHPGLPADEAGFFFLVVIREWNFILNFGKSIHKLLMYIYIHI